MENKPNLEELQMQKFGEIKDIPSLIDAFYTMGPYERQHSLSVKEKTQFILEEMKAHRPDLIPPNTNIGHISFAAFVHDIGKLTTPHDVLHKQGKLTDQEFAQMKDHAHQTGVALNNVAELQDHKDIINMAANHHEAMDGSGYPRRLNQDQIDFGAKLLRVVDCFDAMTMDRQYRPGMSIDKTLDILENSDMKNGKIDPEIFKFVASIADEVYATKPLTIDPSRPLFEQNAVKEMLNGSRFPNFTELCDLKAAGVNIDLSTLKFSNPEVGIMTPKTMAQHLLDLPYYEKTQNIPALATLSEACYKMGMHKEGILVEASKYQTEYFKELDEINRPFASPIVFKNDKASEKARELMMEMRAKNSKTVMPERVRKAVLKQAREDGIEPMRRASGDDVNR